MDALHNLIESTSPEEWLSALPEEDQYTFQTSLQHMHLEMSELGATVSVDRMDQIKKEFHKFICGHEDYAEERKEINDFINKKNGVKDLVVAFITGVLAAHFGAMAAIIAQLVVWLLAVTAKMGINAYCAMNPLEA